MQAGVIIHLERRFLGKYRLNVFLKAKNVDFLNLKQVFIPKTK